MKRKRIIPAILAAALLFTSALAQSSAQVNHSTGEVTYSVQANEASVATLFVRAQGSEEYLFADFLTAQDGAFTGSFLLPEDAAGGYYELIFFRRTDDMPETIQVFYADEATSAAILEAFQAVSSCEEFDVLVLEYQDVLAISMDTYNQLRDHESVYQTIKNGTYATLSDLSSALREAIDSGMLAQNNADALEAFHQATADTMTEVLRQQAAVFGISLDEVYDLYEGYVNGLLLDETVTTVDDVKNAFHRIMAIPYLNVAPRSEILEVIQENDAYLGIYERITDCKESVQVEILKKLESTEYTTLSQIEADIEEIIEDNSSSGNSSGGNGGGGGSGGSSGGGRGSSTTVVTSVDTPTYQEQMEQIRPTTPSEEMTSFTDLETVQWAKEAIESLQEDGILTGDGNGRFYPDRSITRAELAKILVEAFALSGEEEVSFTDLEEGAWYLPYVQTAAAAGVIQGYEDGRFGPEEAVTRQDLAVMVYRCLEEGASSDQLFVDDESIAEYAKEAVYALRGMELLSGNEAGEFLPQQPCTRAECAKIVDGARMSKGE